MEEQIIIVTGAGNGIGLSIVQALLADTRVGLVIAVDLRTERLGILVSQHSARLEVIQSDVTKRATSEAAVGKAIERAGRLDAIVLNAGMLGPISYIADGDIVEWKRTFDVNFFSLLHAIQVALPHLRNRGGRVIMTSSGVSLKPSPSWSAYACAKAAMNHLCGNLALEEPSISTLCVTPGIVDTDMQREVREQHKDSMVKTQYDWLVNLHRDGQLISPELPALSFAKLAVNGIPGQIVGKVVSWNDALII